jgi:hypothetical protein
MGQPVVHFEIIGKDANKTKNNFTTETQRHRGHRVETALQNLYSDSRNSLNSSAWHALQGAAICYSRGA